MGIVREAALFAAVLPGLLAAADIDQNLKDVFAKAKGERVAVVGLGDSNQRFGGHGWTMYMAAALSGRFGCWGSGVAWASPEAGHDAFSGWCVPPGATTRVSWRNGQLNLPAHHPLGLDGPLRFTYSYGTFKEGAGSFMPSIRVDQPPWTVLASSPELKTANGAFGVERAVVELPARPGRGAPLMFSAAPVSVDIVGPFRGECMQVENLGKTSGIAYSTLYAVGGKSLRYMLKTIRDDWGEAKVAEFLREVRAPLTGSKTCVVMISSGLNDRNEPPPGDSPAAFRDRLRCLVDTLEKAWLRAGGAKETIFFAFMPSHPVAVPDDPKLVAYREEACRLARSLPNASCILLPELVPQAEMAAKKYYDQGVASSPHLSPAGYAALSEAVAAAIAK